MQFRNIPESDYPMGTDRLLDGMRHCLSYFFRTAGIALNSGV